MADSRELAVYDKKGETVATIDLDAGSRVEVSGETTVMVGEETTVVRKPIDDETDEGDK